MPIQGLAHLDLAASPLAVSAASPPAHCRTWWRQGRALSIGLVGYSSAVSPLLVQAGLALETCHAVSVDYVLCEAFDCNSQVRTKQQARYHPDECGTPVAMTVILTLITASHDFRASGPRWIPASRRSLLPVLRFAGAGCVLVVGSAANNTVRASELRWSPAPFRSSLPTPPPAGGRRMRALPG